MFEREAGAASIRHLEWRRDAIRRAQQRHGHIKNADLLSNFEIAKLAGDLDRMQSFAHEARTPIVETSQPND
jgi:hypothetical protein